MGSDAEGDDVPAVEAGVMDIGTALQEVLKTALIHDGLSRGLRECAKALDKRHVEALCAEHGIDLMKVEDNKKLGEWAGLCKIDKEGKARKIVGCSCVVVKDYGKETQAHDVLNEYFKSKR